MHGMVHRRVFKKVSYRRLLLIVCFANHLVLTTLLTTQSLQVPPPPNLFQFAAQYKKRVVARSESIL